MKCSNCHLENSDDARFCLACHQEMPATGGRGLAAMSVSRWSFSEPYPAAAAIDPDDDSAHPPSLTWVDAGPRRGLIIASALLLLALLAIAGYLFNNGSFASNELRLGTPWEDPAVTLADMPPSEDFAETPAAPAPSAAPAAAPALAPATAPAPQKESELPPEPPPAQKALPVQKSEPLQKAELVQMPVPRQNPGPKPDAESKPSGEPKPSAQPAPQLEPKQKAEPLQRLEPQQKPAAPQKAEPPLKQEITQKPEITKKPQPISEPTKKQPPKQKPKQKPKQEPAPVAEAKAVPPASAPAPANARAAVAHKPPTMVVAKDAEAATARPVVRVKDEDAAPAVAPKPKARSANWYRDLKGEIGRCANEGNFFSRLICTEKAKFRYCGPGEHWGEVPECIQAQRQAGNNY